MEDIANLKRISEDDSGSAGVKAARLGALTKGFNVPPGYVIMRGVFDKFIEANQLRGKIRNHISFAGEADDEKLQEIANEIQKLVLSGSIDEETRENMIESYYSLNIRDDAPLQELVDSSSEPVVVVRASPVHPTGSKANISILHVKGKDKLLKSIIACFASAFTAEAVKGRLNAKQDDYGMAVLVQKMIMPHVSGDIRQEDSEIIIRSCFGLSDESTEFDRYVVSGELEIKTATAARQRKAYMQDPETGKLSRVELTEARSQSEKLSAKQVLALARLYRKAGLGGRQVEYIIDKENYHFVQVLDMEKKPIDNRAASGNSGQDEPEKVVVKAEENQQSPSHAEGAGENTLFSLFKANRGDKLPDIPTEPKPEKKPEQAQQVPKTSIVEEESPEEEVVEYEEEEEKQQTQETPAGIEREELEEAELDRDAEVQEESEPEPLREAEAETADETQPLTSEEWYDTLRMEHTKMLISYDLVILSALKRKYFHYFREEAPNFEEMIDRLSTKTKVPYAEGIKKIRRMRNDFLQDHKTITMEELKESYETTVLFLREFS